MPIKRAGALLVLALIVVAALAVSMTSSITRGDAVFGLGSWLIYVGFAALATGAALVGVRLRRRAMRRPTTTSRRTVFLLTLFFAAASFPVEVTWEEELGGRAHGLVPAAQAMALPIWPRSAWGSAGRPREPMLGYAYTCCG